MLVNFIGCPCAGKTTIAAGVFAELKQRGVDADFITERAREYIARKRYMEGVDFTLRDSDQWKIFEEQDDVQRHMHGTGNVVVCDSDPLLTLLYMKDIKTHVYMWQIEKIVSRMGVLIYCPPLEDYSKTGNRIHDREFALDIDRRILPHYQQLAPNVPIVFAPVGTVKEKVSFVLDSLSKLGVA